MLFYYIPIYIGNNLSLNCEGGYYRYRGKTMYGVIGLVIYLLKMLYMYFKYKN